jgi:hypothetical protein
LIYNESAAKAKAMLNDVSLEKKRRGEEGIEAEALKVRSTSVLAFISAQGVSFQEFIMKEIDVT